MHKDLCHLGHKSVAPASFKVCCTPGLSFTECIRSQGLVTFRTSKLVGCEIHTLTSKCGRLLHYQTSVSMLSRYGMIQTL